MDLAAIRKNMATAVSGIAGLQALPSLVGAIVAPTWISGEPQEIRYHQTFSTGGLNEILLVGRIYASRADDLAGQQRLDGFLSPTGATSIPAAIEADLTLAGACRTLVVERAHSYGMWTVGGVDYYGAHLDIRIWG